MSHLQRVGKTLGLLGLALAFPSLLSAQSGYVASGDEYAPAGSLPGDQVYPSLSLTPSGGYLVWQDNITDGNGYGISAVRLDANFSPAMSNFRVNQNGANDQERPQVSAFKSGGAAIVWQGGKQSFQHIYGSFLSSSNTFVVRDITINTATNWQTTPTIATLTNGNVIVAWASYGQDNSDGLLGVYAQLLTPLGTKVGGEFAVNQATASNQRTPSVAALGNGNFVVAWVSERQRSVQSVSSSGETGSGHNSVDIYARIFNSGGSPVGNEFLVNTSTNVCANPSVAASSDGTFAIAWAEKDGMERNNSWDIYSRKFSGTGSGGAVNRVNTQRYGDQFAPKISAAGSDYLVVWTSLGQDGSREGVYGQYLRSDGTLAGGEFRVNTTYLNQQIYPAVSSDGFGRFLVAWSSYVGDLNSMDLNAQRYATTNQPLSAPEPPIVSALDSYTLSVTWPPLEGFSVAYWELYVDGAASPILVTNTYWQNASLETTDYNALYNPSSTHTFQLGYVLVDGRHSPLSGVATGRTWGVDRYGAGPGNSSPDGLPDDWQALYWGSNKANWPNIDAPLVPGGPTPRMVFMWGANPLDPSTWLRTKLEASPQGWFLSWSTVPGVIYGVQTSTDLHNWSALTGARFAAGTMDSIYLGLSGHGYYRIARLVY